MRGRLARTGRGQGRLRRRSANGLERPVPARWYRDVELAADLCERGAGYPVPRCDLRSGLVPELVVELLASEMHGHEHGATRARPKRCGRGRRMRANAEAYVIPAGAR